MQQSQPIEAAKTYARRGWPVFRVSPRGKIPMRGSRGCLDATADEAAVCRWWQDAPEANVGIATGLRAGCWVLDIDGERGAQSLAELEAEIGALPETLEQATGSGGRHLFFSWPEREVRNRQNVRAGIDVRGEGGYIVAPPSVHPSGNAYRWTNDLPIAEAPTALLDLVAPAEKTVAPWERIAPRKPVQAPAPAPVSAVGGTPIIERASRYLRECEPAVQGSGGHNALLWAARALVVGFELDDGTALSLLWSEFNPRCSPPWKQSERKDFERKVAEARRTPGTKPRGWLLDEFGLRSGADALAEIARGQESASNLLASCQASPEPEAMQDRPAFPLDYFPPKIADYCRQVAESHVVDESFAGLPMLAVAATAMGNTFRLQLKKGFIVPPTLWVGIVSPSGTNKSGPLSEVIAPLYQPIPIEDTENALLNPQGQKAVVSDATLEAVITRLSESPRGLMVFRDELAGWAKSFNAYKKSGGDEQTWLEFWGAKEYHLDRKTNNEQIHIPAASTCVLGGIQPKILVECFDPGKFASGLVPRLLITCPPASDMYWSEAEVSDDAARVWAEAILWLRKRPFAAFDPNTGRYQPHVLTLTPEAKAHYVDFFNEISGEIAGMENEQARGFASKARVVAGRLMLIHRGLHLASGGYGSMTGPVELDSAKAGVAWARWALAEQMRVYGFTSIEYARQQAETLAEAIRDKHKGRATIRQVQHTNTKRYPNAEAAKDAMEQLVKAGLARWADGSSKKVVLV